MVSYCPSVQLTQNFVQHFLPGIFAPHCYCNISGEISNLRGGKKKKSQRNWRLGRGGLLVFCSHKLSAMHTWPLKGCVRWNNSPGSAAPHVSASLCARCSCTAYHITPATASVLACHSSEAPRPVNSNSQENCGAALELQDHGHLTECLGPVFGV